MSLWDRQYGAVWRRHLDIFLLSVFVKIFVSKVFPLLSSTLLKKCAQMQLIGQKVMSRQLWCSFEAQKHLLLLYFCIVGWRNNKKKWSSYISKALAMLHSQLGFFVPRFLCRSWSFYLWELLELMTLSLKPWGLSFGTGLAQRELSGPHSPPNSRFL